MANKISGKTKATYRRAQIISIWRRLKRDRAAVLGLIILLLLTLTAIFANHIAPYGYDDQDLNRKFIFPNREFPMGTDNLGRDILSRVIFGSRISLMVGLLAVGLAAFFGVFIGSIAGFYGNVMDNLIMRFMDMMLSIPQILLAISMAAILGEGLVNVMIAVGISEIPRYARLTRSSVLSVKEQEYIEAAKAIGASDFQIIYKHILPNCMAPLIVQSTIGVARAIIAASALSFIGLGIQPPIPEWGAMCSIGRAYIRDYWHIVTFPGLMIMITIYALNLLGDGLRDALDPRLKN
jgi:peptide/nickel transport system permease protein